MNQTYQKILDLTEQKGLLRSRDLSNIGLPRIALTRMVRNGLLSRVGRGLYALPKRSGSAHEEITEIARKYPQGIFCLLSALRLHSLTTQSPFEIWLGIANKARAPKADYPPLRIIRYTGIALSEGIENRNIDGVQVRVTNPARTVVECFKFRNKVGLDVALEALREALQEKRTTRDELWRHAKLFRMERVMRPYLESVS